MPLTVSVSGLPVHTGLLLVAELIVGAAITDTASVCAVPEQLPLDGVTEIVPPAVPAVTVIELVVPPAVCDHPDGRTHV